MGMRIGHGYDVHRLAKGRRLILGGTVIPYEKGLLGHSDADVLAHAATDALLGADSLWLLSQVADRVRQAGYAVSNLDATVLAQAPKLAPYIQQMRERLAAACGVEPGQVSVKATTEEGLGFTGTGEGIAAHAVCLLEPLPLGDDSDPDEMV